MCTLHARSNVKLNHTLGEYPATASLRSATPKEKHSLHFCFGEGDFFWKLKGCFLFRGSALNTSVRWRGNGSNGRKWAVGENGLGFAKTIFWGFWFGKTSANFVFAFCPPAERGLGNECGRVLAVFKIAEKGYNKNMERKQSNWEFGFKKFVFIEFIFFALFEASRLLASSKLLNAWCGNGTAPTCTGNACTTVIYTPSCSVFFGGLGMKIFLLLFFAYLVSFIIYKIFKKDIKNVILPLVVIMIIFFSIDWIVRSFS